MGISLDTARKLKDAGLAWEPDLVTSGNVGDQFYWNHGVKDIVGHRDYHLIKPLADGLIIYAPRLDQILAEIEKWGYRYSLARESRGDNYSLMLWKAHCGIEIFYAATAAQAAAQTLLWILEREQNCCAG